MLETHHRYAKNFHDRRFHSLPERPFGLAHALSELLFGMTPRSLQSHLFHFVAVSLLERGEH